MRGQPFSRSGLLAWGSRIHSATEYIPWRPMGLRVFLAAFIATLAILGLRSAVVPAMAAPAEVIMHSPSNHTAPDEVPYAYPSATDLPEQTGEAVEEHTIDDSALISDEAEPEQAVDDDAPASGEPEPPLEGDPSTTRITPTSRGGARPLDSTSAAPASDTKQSDGSRIAAIARKYVGYPYRWAGSSPRTGFDCSGLMGYVYQEAGISIPPHSLAGQLNTGKRVSRDELQPGDLVFFENTFEWGLSHGGIYVGDNQFVHAEAEGIGVVVSALNGGNWASHYLGASRPW